MPKQEGVVMLVWRVWSCGMEGVAMWYGGCGHVAWRVWPCGMEGVVMWYGGYGHVVWRV